MQSSISSPGHLGALSLLTPIGYQSGDCGYCKANDSSQRTPDSRASYYVRSTALTPEHYQELMDRGWRRSGNLLYLPDASRSCCPHYTIRLPSSDFKPTRDQRQALNRWNRYILGDKYIKDSSVKFPKTKEQKKRMNNEFDLRTTLHESEFSNLNPGIDPDHRFEVTLEPDKLTKEKFALFDNYQRNVHKEKDGDISERGFKRFLCSSPLARHIDGGKKLGSYHQCYRLDGRLIAMGVLDLLPHAVSGVYFIYHHDFEKWSFGKLSALREAALALELSYQYYYMGYYIHSCKKMRYKADYKPQYVLDFHSLDWNILDDEMRSLMESRKYASMSAERKKKSLLEQADSEQTESDAIDSSSSQEEPLKDFDTIQHPTPAEATSSGLSLLQLSVPGVTSLTTLRDEVDLDRMKVHIGNGKIHHTRDIQSWTTGSELDPHSLKGVFAEIAAAVGPTVAREAVVDFA